MTAVRKALMTHAEFLDWAAAQDGKWELFDGVPVAMSPERVFHGETKYRVTRALEAAIQANRPLCLLGTAFMFVHWLDHAGATKRRFRLPPGSRLLETGGYKGRTRVVPRPELHRLLG